jgi:PAS domain S-box-containing protein
LSEPAIGLWENIVQSTNGAICVFDAEFRLIAFNQAHNDEFFRVNGYYTRIGDIFPDLFVPEQGPVMRAQMARALAGEAFTVVEDFGNPVLGHPYWEISYTPLRDETGRVFAAFHHAVDISDRLHVEADRRTLAHRVAEQTKELTESRARLRSMFETSFGFLVLLTKAGVLTDANATSLEAIGRPIEAVVGRLFWETPWFAATPGMVDKVRETVLLVAGGEVVRHEIMVDLPVGGWRWFDFAMRPIRNADGTIGALVAEAIETTERRRVEEALRQSQKLEAMGQLTGGVAHDFNNLLTPIIGTLDLLQRRAIGGERERRLIEGGLQAADRARTLVQRLLAFARRQPLKSSPVDLPQLVHGMVELIRRTLGPTIRVEVEAGAAVPAARADPGQLEMAILNMAVNARDAMPDGGTLTLSVAVEAIGPGHVANLPPGDYIRLSVRDTGTGMDEETRARAIEPFYSTKGVGKGTGLGLSMVHGLAAQLGGGLAIDSAPGAGTRIDLWLTPSGSSARAEAGPDRAMPRISKLGVALLVDDEEIVRAVTADMLIELGYAVVEAASAEAGLERIVRGEAIDILITDHLMPGMSGAELARIVRRRRPDLPILLVSGYAEMAEVAPDLPRLAKPFRQAELADSVSALTAAMRG